jgi:hypothetical protein
MGGPSDQIPQKLRDAFRDAIGQYGNWRRGEPEPDVSLKMQPFAISTVCEFVSKFEDPMPADYWHFLARVTRGGEDLPNDDQQSYRSAARFLAHLIRERKAQFDRPDPSWSRSKNQMAPARL